MEDFKQKFIIEAQEHISELEQALLELEHNPNDKQIVERIFRSMHSLKGGGAMFGFDLISHFTHDLETVYDMVRQDKMALSEALINVTLQSVDHLKQLLSQSGDLEGELLATNQSLLFAISKIVSKKSQDPISAPTVKESISTFYIHFVPNETVFDDGTNISYILEDLAELGKVILYPNGSRLSNFETFNPEHCYLEWEILLTTTHSANAINDVFIFIESKSVIHIEKLGSVDLLNNESFIAFCESQFAENNSIGYKNITAHLKQNTIPTQNNSSANQTTVQQAASSLNSIRVSTDKLDTLMNLVSELVTTQARLTLFSEKTANPELSSIAENMQKLTRELRDNAFSIVLVPIESLIVRFQRLIRDLSVDLKKDVQFEVFGSETELDKSIIENITDPLMHIFRNSMDHGVELPEEREAMGKPKRGKITLRAFHTGPQVCIQISDDGRGIDTAKVRKKAIERGLITAEQSLTEKEIFELIFTSGFSTAETVSDISGRGVGMDVVKKKLAQVRGEVEVESQLSKGTTITIKLPLTLSIIDGLLVRVDATYFIIPLTAVAKIYGIEHHLIENSFNNHVILDDKYYPFIYLRNLFGIKTNSPSQEELLLISYQDKTVGIVIDTVIGEYQAVLKPLGKHYKNQDVLSGASILGDGTVALVIDTNKLVKSFATNTVTEEMTYGN